MPTKKTNTEDLEEIKRTYSFMCQEGLFSLDLEKGDYKIRLKRRLPKKTLPAQRKLPLVEEKKESVKLNTVKSPLTGVFFRAPSPKVQPFVETGQVVEKGQVLCIIEAMKVMNEILAEARCRIEKILVENGQLVLTGQEIFAISLLEA